MLMVLATNRLATSDNLLWQDFAEILGQPAPRHPPDVCTDELNSRHQRVCQHHGPEHIEAELRAGLRIGGDAAWIIIRRSGDEARSQLLEDGGSAQPLFQLAPSHHGSSRTEPVRYAEAWVQMPRPYGPGFITTLMQPSLRSRNFL
jgi:hypothetical protein